MSAKKASISEDAKTAFSFFGGYRYIDMPGAVVSIIDEKSLRGSHSSRKLDHRISGEEVLLIDL